MEQSGVLGFNLGGDGSLAVIRNSPFCTHEAFANMVGVSEDTARGWVEMGTIPTLKIGRRCVVNLSRILSDPFLCLRWQGSLSQDQKQP
ncbi:DNA-binding protein [Halopseudomonas sp.]|uniref:DNA-binding protein n=1 Tax=Halopseudomonas sp. TaxID=2901191 RepID=UPI003002903E|tara:strand:+ start:5957 stop:6223 length:267 start_codon:yes stop_codon:yes gene_type:complete